MNFRRLALVTVSLLFTLSLCGCAEKITIDAMKLDKGAQAVKVKYSGDLCLDFVPEVYVDKDSGVWQYCEAYIPADMKKHYFYWKSGPGQDAYSKSVDRRPDFLSKYQRVSLSRCGPNKYCGEYGVAGYKFELWKEGRFDNYLEYSVKQQDQAEIQKPQTGVQKPAAPEKGFVINRDDSKVHFNPPKTLFVTPLVNQANAPAANVYFGLATIKPGAVVPLHDHGSTYEILYVQSGGATVTIGEMMYKLKPGSIAYFPAHVKHGLLNDTDQDLVGIQVYAPPGNPTADGRYYNWPAVGK